MPKSASMITRCITVSEKELYDFLVQKYEDRFEVPPNGADVRLESSVDRVWREGNRDVPSGRPSSKSAARLTVEYEEESK